MSDDAGGADVSDRFDSDKGRTHYIGDDCPGGHRGDEAADLMCNVLGKQMDPHWKPDPVTVEMVADVVAAAEERGRRAGREEAAKIVESYTNILAIDHIAARIRADK